MQLVLRGEAKYSLQRTAPMPQVKDKTRTLTVGKVNIIRADVKRALPWGPTTFFRKGP